MIKSNNPSMQRHIQLRLFTTIARSLVSQLAGSGVTWLEMIDLVNELLDEIVRLGTIDAVTDSSGQTHDALNSFMVLSGDYEKAELLSRWGRADLGTGLYLRSMELTDRDALYQWCQDRDIARSLALPVLDRLINPGSYQCTQPTRELFFVLCTGQTDRPIGLFGLVDINECIRQAALFKMIGDKNERGKGYARLATRVLLSYAFNAVQLNRVYLHTLDGNHKNICLNMSLGFKFEGLLEQGTQVNGHCRDVIVMGLLRRDYLHSYQGVTASGTAAGEAMLEKTV